MSTTKVNTEKANDEQIFQAKQLPTFSPYQIVGIDTHTKRVTGKTAAGKEYDFDSKNHTLTIIPQKNKNITVKVNVFDQEYQNLLAIATVWGGFSKCVISTSIDPSSTSRAIKFIHTPTGVAN